MPRSAPRSRQRLFGSRRGTRRSGSGPRPPARKSRGSSAARAKLVTFTSGGTEANVTVLTPEWTHGGKPFRADTLLVGATEHLSVLAGGRFPADRVHPVPVDGDGIIELAALEATLAKIAKRGGRALVWLMLANNETGVIQPVAEAPRSSARPAAGPRRRRPGRGQDALDIGALGADTLAISAHKIGGPQGAGAIVGPARTSPRAAPHRRRPGEAAARAPKMSRQSPVSALPPRPRSPISIRRTLRPAGATPCRLLAQPAEAPVFGDGGAACRRPCASRSPGFRPKRR